MTEDKDLLISLTWQKPDGTEMVSIDTGKTSVVISAEKLKTDKRFCDSPIVKEYLATLYH